MARQPTSPDFWCTTAPWYAAKVQRRQFAIAVAICALSPARMAFAANASLPKVGVLWVSDPSWLADYFPPFKEALAQLNWVDGRTVQILERYDSGDHRKRVLQSAKELVALGVNVLFVTDDGVAAAREATTEIPIVCTDFYDPIVEGVTHSMARPDGNVTGVSWQSIETSAKRLQLTKELIPKLQRFSHLFPTTSPGAVIEAQGLAKAARELGLRFSERSSERGARSSGCTRET